MNIREVETLLVEIAKEGNDQRSIDTQYAIESAIRWCRSQQKASATRKALFKHRADEQRELLR